MVWGAGLLAMGCCLALLAGRAREGDEVGVMEQLEKLQLEHVWHLKDCTQRTAGVRSVNRLVENNYNNLSAHSMSGRCRPLDGYYSHFKEV